MVYNTTTNLKPESCCNLEGVNSKDDINYLCINTNRNLWCATLLRSLLNLTKEPPKRGYDSYMWNERCFYLEHGSIRALPIVGEQSKFTRYNLLTESNFKNYTADEQISLSTFRQKATYIEKKTINIEGTVVLYPFIWKWFRQLPKSPSSTNHWYNRE